VKILLAWSSGKDSAWALHELRQRGDVEVVGLLTTINAARARVTMHAVREELVDAQAARAGLPLLKVHVPDPCPNDLYERAMGEVLDRAIAEGVTGVAFGDLFLEDVRRWREEKLRAKRLDALFPLWGRNTRELAESMIAGGLAAIVTCVDTRQCPLDALGRAFDASFLDRLPPSADPCGENGEFHTFVTAGPMFSAPLAVRTGATFQREGFADVDLVLR
jgi:uncharacterized protein (TIGR00290 family)